MAKPEQLAARAKEAADISLVEIIESLGSRADDKGHSRTLAHGCEAPALAMRS